ncbi:TNF receptor-associated factor 3-like [Montipora capricornis]|uniref:TNF receptor-associated factor 3-like n=1 Tax=Montipora capricornis TaxID=246305 RepID=UPI0035F17E0F
MSQSASAVAFNCVLTGSVDDRLQCCICFVTMLKPVSLKCGHSWCQICMEEHVRKAVNPTCPICRAVINDETLSVNIALDNLTKEMPVRCVISGCDWTGVYGSAKSHYERCPKVEVTCKQDGCEQQLPREEMPAHEETCGKKRIRCSECRRAVKRDAMEMQWSIALLGVRHHYQGFLQLQGGEMPITSDIFSMGKKRWRVVITKKMELAVQLLASCQPQTVQIRIVMMPGEEKEEVFVLQHTTLKEGEMQGISLKDIIKWVNRDGELKIKIIIYYLRF